MSYPSDSPDAWPLRPLKTALRLTYGDALPSENRVDGSVAVYGSNGPVGTHDASNMLAPAVVVGRKGSFGKITFAEAGGFCIDTAYFVDARSVSCNLRWAYWALQTLQLDEVTEDTGVPGLSRELAHNKRVPVPSLEHQSTIAKYLDRETGRIDALIEKKTRFIELLREKRQALITQAVTQGLDLSVPMRDSGVEWLGRVPAHWAVRRLKHVCGLIKDGTHLPPARVSDGVSLLSVRNLVDGEFTRLPDDSMISESDYADLCRSFIPKAGDVLLAIVGATLGKCAILPKDFGRFHLQRSVAAFRPIADLQSSWLRIVFESEGFQSLLWEHAGYSAQPGIYLGTLNTFKVPLPPLSEQSAILHKLKPNLERFRNLEALTSKSIKLLAERRSALIIAAVTGQIDLREAA